MNYIGSKRRLLQFVYQTIGKYWQAEPGVFCDAFAGTGVVAEKFKREGWSVQASDLQYYSYVRLQHLIGNTDKPDFVKIKKEAGADVFAHLNALPGKEGFIFQNFCLGGTRGKEWERQYFSDDNGRRCDAIRDQIDDWRARSLLSDPEYFYLLSSLLESMDKRANTASVYGAFLKKLKKSAREPLLLEPLPIHSSRVKHSVYHKDALELLGQISGDVLYLDPPYNQRQYAANYHLLETVALWDKPLLQGKTGLRDWSTQKSPWCSSRTALPAFKELLRVANYPLIALSYNDEGIMSLQEIKEAMSAHGRYSLHRKRYSRFRADQEGARNHKRNYVYEYLHILEKRS